jgi:hypothetical protein
MAGAVLLRAKSELGKIVLLVAEGVGVGAKGEFGVRLSSAHATSLPHGF